MLLLLVGRSVGISNTFSVTRVIKAVAMVGKVVEVVDSVVTSRPLLLFLEMREVQTPQLGTRTTCEDVRSIRTR